MEQAITILLKMIFSVFICLFVGFCMCIPKGISQEEISGGYILFALGVGLVFAIGMWPEL